MPAESPRRSLLERLEFSLPGNIHWLLITASCLVAGSSVMLVSQHWQTLAPTLRYLIVTCYTAGFWGLGELLFHRRRLRMSGNTLLALSAGLIPLTFFVLSRVGAWGNVLLAVHMTLATLLVNRLFRHFFLTQPWTTTCCFVASCTSLYWLPRLGVLENPLLLWVALWLLYAIGTLKLDRHLFALTESGRAPRVIAFVPQMLLGSTFLLASGMFLVPSIPSSRYGLLAALAGLPVVLSGSTLISVLRTRSGDTSSKYLARTLLPVALGFLLLIGGVTLTLGQTWSIEVARQLVVVMMLLAIGGFRLYFASGNAGVATLSMIAAIVAYNFIPSYFEQGFLRSAQWAADKVEESKLPFAFYGLTYLPLLSLLLWVGRALELRSLYHRIERARFVRTTLVLLTSVLAVIALTHDKAQLLVGVALLGLMLLQRVLWPSARLSHLLPLGGILCAIGFEPFVEQLLGLPALGARSTHLAIASVLFLASKRGNPSNSTAVRSAGSAWGSLVAITWGGFLCLRELTSAPDDGLTSASMQLPAVMAAAIFLSQRYGSSLCCGATVFFGAVASTLLLWRWLPEQQLFPVLMLLAIGAERVSAQWRARAPHWLEPLRWVANAALVACVLFQTFLLGLSTMGSTPAMLQPWTIAVLMGWCALAPLHPRSTAPVKPWPLCGPIASWLLGLLAVVAYCQDTWALLPLIASCCGAAWIYSLILERRQIPNVTLRRSTEWVLWVVAALPLLNWESSVAVAGLIALTFLIAGCHSYRGPAYALLTWCGCFQLIAGVSVQADSLLQWLLQHSRDESVGLAALLTVCAFVWRLLAAARSDTRPLWLNTHLAAMPIASASLLLSLLLTPHPSILVQVTSILTIGCNALLVLRGGVRHETPRQLYLLLAWIGLGATLSTRWGYFELGAWPGLAILAGFSLLSHVTHSIATRRTPNSSWIPLIAQLSLWSPLLLGLWGIGGVLDSASLAWGNLAAFAAAAHYFREGQRQATPFHLLVAGLFFNSALFLTWPRLGLDDVQFYAIPLGASTLVGVQVLRSQLPHEWIQPLRVGSALIILLSPISDIIQGSWLHILTLMVSSVAMLLTSMALRLRSLLRLSFAALLVDMLTLVVRGSVAHISVLWITGLVLGISVLVLAILAEEQRQAIEQQIRKLRALLDDWDAAETVSRPELQLKPTTTCNNEVNRTVGVRRTVSGVRRTALGARNTAFRLGRADRVRRAALRVRRTGTATSPTETRLSPPPLPSRRGDIEPHTQT